jgi:YegS/Rv2252/BmrU family lipid kinase
MKKLVFIVNPVAKNGASLKTWKKVEEHLQYINYEVYFSKHKNHAKQIASELAKTNSEPFVIVAVGGDGTIHEVINGVISFEHVTLAYIPAGSGNDFARGFELPKHPEDCISLILKMVNSSGNRFDAGYYHLDGQSGYFVNSLGAGFDAVISEKANLSSLKKVLNKFSLGKLVYALYLIIELFRFKPVTMKLKIDKVEYKFEKTWFVTISNQPYYGGGMQISPHASPIDGELDITVVHHLTKYKLLLVFICVFWGGHLRFKEVTTMKGKEILLQSDHPIKIHVDGEQAGVTPVRIKICNRSWKILNPLSVKNKQSA